jgi:hypothetical protein
VVRGCPVWAERPARRAVDLPGPPFRFGEARWNTEDEDRLAIEFVPQEAGQGEPFRCSIPASTIRNLAAHLLQTASVGEGWREPRRVRRSLMD